MTNDNIVYQANPLVEAVKYDKADENKLFLLCLQGLNPHFKNSKYYDTDFKDTIIPANKLIELFGNNYYYHALVEISKKLLDTKILILDDEKRTFRGYNVFEYIEFGKAFGGLHYKFTNSMKPFLLDLYDKGYVGIDIKEIFSFSSSYALRILELLLQYKGYAKDGKYSREFSIDKLRIYLKVPSQSYQQPSSFVAYVIKNPVKQINIKTRYKIEYTIQRKGKKAIGITFQVTLPKDMPVKETIDVDIKEDISMVDTSVAPAELPALENPSAFAEGNERQEPKNPRKRLEDFTKEEVYALEKLLRFKIAEKIVFATLEKYGVKAINWAIKNYQNTKSRGVAINNPAGFILDKIQEYNESEVTAEDIFKLVEKFEAEEEAERIKAKEEAERKRTDERAKKSTEEAIRLKIRSQYSEEELEAVKEKIFQEYDDVGGLNDDIREKLKKYGLTEGDLRTLKIKYMSGKQPKVNRSRKETSASSKPSEPLEENFIVQAIKSYYRENKRFSDDILEELESKGWTETQFKASFLNKFIEIGGEIG